MTTSEHRIDVYQPATNGGELVAQIDGTSFRNLAYTRAVNAPGVLSFGVDTDHPAFPYIVNDAIIEIWRRNVSQGLDWYRDYVALIRSIQREYTNHDRLNVQCAGLLSLLARRIIAWYASTSNRSSFAAVVAETIMKTLVSYNAGSFATTGNSRLRNGIIAGLGVQGDGAQGNALSLSCAYDNLLSTLQFISSPGGGGGDFDLVRTGETTCEFRWYSGQLGTDRTASIIFALEYDNMAHPVYTVNTFNLKSVAIVGGQGQDSARAVAIRTGSEYASGVDIETFVNGNNEATAAALNSKGDIALAQVRNKVKSFNFDVLQTPSYFYGQHYFLGDLVSYKYASISGTIKVNTVTISVDDDTGKENVQVDMLEVE